MEKREEESAVWCDVEECSGEVGVMPAGCSRGGEDGLRGRGRAERERVERERGTTEREGVQKRIGAERWRESEGEWRRREGAEMERE